MSKNEEEVIGANPYCLKCQKEITDGRICFLLMKRGSVVFHEGCFLMALDVFAPKKADQGTIAVAN